VWEPSSVEVMKGRYEAMSLSPLYSALASTVPVIGTWDDHDYGKRCGGVQVVLLKMTFGRVKGMIMLVGASP